MSNLLMEIAAHKKREVEELEQKLPIEKVEKQLTTSDIIDFKAAISNKQRVNIIAEIKKASPSKGVLSHDFDPAKLALTYSQGGAAALSVLADEKYFQGSPEYIQVAKRNAELPVLFKEFVISKYQINYARMMKADAILLIVKLLNEAKLRDFRELAAELGMVTLVEVHDESELKVAVDSGADIIGVNNRNLENFNVTLETSEKMCGLIPKNVIKVAESGISNVTQISRLKNAGYDSFLVGESLLKSADPINLLRSMQAI